MNRYVVVTRTDMAGGRRVVHAYSVPDRVAGQRLRRRFLSDPRASAAHLEVSVCKLITTEEVT